MKTFFTFIAALFTGLLVVVAQQKNPESPKAGVEYRAIDEGGAPVEGAEASVGFTILGDIKSIHGFTDAAGGFQAENSSDDGFVLGGVKKDGYYRSMAKKLRYNINDIKDNRWQPWKPMITVVMKKIENPIPLYGKRAQLALPSFKEPVGYDLATGDWVAPHGKGTISDFVISGHSNRRGSDDHQEGAALVFSNPEDGLQSIYVDPDEGSALRLRSAPRNGYAEKKWDRSFFIRPGLRKSQEGERPDQCYFFRVRTVTKNGKIESAHYGKIYGPIRWQTHRVGEKEGVGIEFKYFFNPTVNDLNLEFDQNRNLFPHLPENEEPHEP